MVFKIFKRDLKKIFTNSMAIILAVGIAVLPSLYAWINIYANWDPYGSTGNMQVAVIIEDEGYTYKDVKINVGEQIKENLKGNDAIDWQFVNKKQGMEGVEASKYYAAIYIPADFSKSLTSIMTPNFTQPKITYYANEKKNAIATKITDKVVQTVQAEVNESFVQTVVNVVDKLLITVVEEVSDNGTGVFNSIASELNGAQNSIKSIKSAINGFSEIMSIAQQLNTSLSELKVDELVTDLDKTIKDTENVIDVTKANISILVSSVDTVLNSASLTLNNSATAVEKIADKSSEDAIKDFNIAYNEVTSVEQKVKSAIEVLKAIETSVKSKDLSSAISKLEKIDTSLNNAIKMMEDAMKSSSIKDNASKVSDALRKISNSIENVTKDFDGKVQPKLKKKAGALADNKLKDTNDIISVIKSAVSNVFGSVDTVLDSATNSLKDSANSIDKAANKTNEDLVKEINVAYGKATEVEKTVKTVIDSLKKIDGFMHSNALNKPISKLEKIDKDLLSVIGKMNGSVDAKKIKNSAIEISRALKKISSSISDVSKDYKKNVQPKLENNVNSLMGVLADVSNVLNAIKADVPLMNSMLETLNGSLAAGDDMITSLNYLLDSCNDDIDALTNKLNALSENEILNTLINLTKESQEDVGAFLACPVEINTEKVYSIENYGSAMAPFYSTLAIWVGAIILVAIFKTNVKNKKELGIVKPYQEFFGRSLIFILFAIIQSAIVCAGDLLFLGIQCYHPVMFMLSGIIASVVFSFFIYSLVSAWGDIGKSIAVILLVLQLGGSGGTFPIDVTPKLFRAIYDYLPFTYVINAMRECICGTYSNDYWINLLKLLAFVLISLVIGIFFRFIFKNPVKFFNKRIEETGLL